MKPQMSKDLFLQNQITIVQIGQVSMKLDLDGFLDLINRAEATAPSLNPSVLIKATENLEAIKALAKTLVPVKAAAENLIKLMTKVEPLITP